MSFVAILFVATLVALFLVSRQAIRDEALAKASLTLDNSVQIIDGFLGRVEVATIGMHWNVEHHLDSVALLETYCHRLLEDNPGIVGCAIALEPSFNTELGKENMLYLYRPIYSDSLNHTASPVLTHSYGKTSYLMQNWYTLTVSQDKPCWVKPTENNADGKPLASYCMPLHSNGRVVGVMGVDILLDAFSKIIINTKPFPHSYCSFIGRRGTYVIHPDTTKLQRRTVYDLLDGTHDPRMPELLQSMMNGESGRRLVEIDGRECYVFYKPFRYKAWVATIVCPVSDVLATNKRLQTSALLIAIVGLLVLTTFCFLFLRRIFHPLDLLSATARRLASGQYDEPVPPTTRQDEVGSLQNGFYAMQRSIVRHLSDIRQVNDAMKESNEALSIANEQAQEAERVMNAFIANVSDQMVQPVDAIQAMMAELRRGDQEEGHQQVAAMADQLQHHTKSVTTLLDRMLEVSQKKGGES